MAVETIVYYERPLYNYAGERVDLGEIRRLLSSGPIYLFGLPWSGKTTVARAVFSTLVSDLVSVGHKIGALSKGRYGVTGWRVEVDSAVVNVAHVDLEPRMPSGTYSLDLALILSTYHSRLTRSVEAIIGLLAKLFPWWKPPREAWERLSTALRLGRLTSAISAVLDLAATVRFGVSHRQVIRTIRELSGLRGKADMRVIPVIIDDAEALPPGTRSLAVDLASLYTGCRWTVVVYALLPHQAKELPSRVAGDTEALEFLKNAGITHCGNIDGLARRVIFVPPDVGLASKVVSKLAPLVDTERLAEESHGLPGVAVALVAGGSLSLAGMPLGSHGLQDAIRGLVANLVEKDPAVALLAVGGPLWGDTLGRIAPGLARILAEKSRDPRILSTLKARGRTLYRLLLLGAAWRLASRALLGEYAPDPGVVDAYSSRDGRLLLSYRREIGDFLETAIRSLLSSGEHRPVELMVSSLVSSLPQAMIELEKSNPVADLFAARASALAIEHGLDSETARRAYLAAVTSLLLNSPGLARSVPIVELRGDLDGDEEAAVLALKLAYQSAQARISNPSLPDISEHMGIWTFMRKAREKGGLQGALALMAEAGKARSEAGLNHLKTLASEILDSLRKAYGCAEKLALLRGLLDTAAALAELEASGVENLLEKRLKPLKNYQETQDNAQTPEN